eukprot:1159201-Pelagomonas_calceolata.AAC.14
MPKALTLASLHAHVYRNVDAPAVCVACLESPLLLLLLVAYALYSLTGLSAPASVSVVGRRKRIGFPFGPSGAAVQSPSFPFPQTASSQCLLFKLFVQEEWPGSSSQGIALIFSGRL